jgi:hypothetical protein
MLHLYIAVPFDSTSKRQTLVCNINMPSRTLMKWIGDVRPAINHRAMNNAPLMGLNTKFNLSL